MDSLRYTVIPYDEKYRDDMIFMVLEAKDALGRVPRLNEDLLDVQRNYLDTGDMFWLAIDENDRVIGCIGYNSISGTTEVKLHRLYIKATRKRQGIGTHLLYIDGIHRQKVHFIFLIYHLARMSSISLSQSSWSSENKKSPYRAVVSTILYGDGARILIEFREKPSNTNGFLQSSNSTFPSYKVHRTPKKYQLLSLLFICHRFASGLFR